MTRAIVVPPVVPPAALAELKAWLGITTARDDAELLALICSALDLCEAFTGIVPLLCEWQDRFVPAAAWRLLPARPVQSITAVEAIGAGGLRITLPVTDYAIDLDADGGGRVRLMQGNGDQRQVAVRFTAGLASAWDDLPAALRQGVVRLAAHQHRQRDAAEAGALPAAVAALWRPYRRMRIG